MSKCIKCKSTEDYNFAIDNGMCNPCIEGTLENIQDDNVVKEGRVKELEGLLDRVITSVGRAIPARLRIDIDKAIDKSKEQSNE